MKTQAENQAHQRVLCTLQPFPRTPSVSGIGDFYGYQHTVQGHCSEPRNNREGPSHGVISGTKSFCVSENSQRRLGIPFMNQDFSATSNSIFSCVLQVLCQLLYRE